MIAVFIIALYIHVTCIMAYQLLGAIERSDFNHTWLFQIHKYSVFHWRQFSI